MNVFVLALIHGKNLIVFSFGNNLEANHKIRYSSLIYLFGSFPVDLDILDKYVISTQRRTVACLCSSFFVLIEASVWRTKTKIM